MKCDSSSLTLKQHFKKGLLGQLTLLYLHSNSQMSTTLTQNMEKEGFVWPLRSWCDSVSGTLLHGIACALALRAFPTSN